MSHNNNKRLFNRCILYFSKKRSRDLVHIFIALHIAKEHKISIHTNNAIIVNSQIVLSINESNQELE